MIVPGEAAAAWQRRAIVGGCRIPVHISTRRPILVAERGVGITSLAVAARFPFAIFVYAFLGWTFDFYDLVLLGFIKDGVVRDLGMSHAMEGWLLGAGLGASGIGGLAAGALADRFGKRRELAATVAIYSLGSLICGGAPTSLIFFLGRI